MAQFSELDEIRKASEHLYDALNHMLNGDSCLMDSIWSQRKEVTTMHPGGGREVGWEKVREKWNQLASVSSDGSVRLRDQLIRLEGDVAYELGTEEGKVKLGGQPVSLEHRVTNIYHREGERWKVVHHHADLAPAVVNALLRLEGEK